MRILIVLTIAILAASPAQAQQDTLARFEQTIRSESVEWAGCFDPTTGIEQWRGTSNRIDMVHLDRFLCMGTIMTHNHVAGYNAYPSEQDFKVAYELRLYQLRVVTPYWTCVIDRAWKPATTYRCERTN